MSYSVTVVIIAIQNVIRISDSSSSFVIVAVYLYMAACQLPLACHAEPPGEDDPEVGGPVVVGGVPLPASDRTEK